MATIKKCDICGTETEKDFAAKLKVSVQQETVDDPVDTPHVAVELDICIECVKKIQDKDLWKKDNFPKVFSKHLSAQIGAFLHNHIDDIATPKGQHEVTNSLKTPVPKQSISQLPKKELDTKRKHGKLVMSAKKSRFIPCKCGGNDNCKYCGGTGQRLMPPDYKPPTDGMASL